MGWDPAGVEAKDLKLHDIGNAKPLEKFEQVFGEISESVSRLDWHDKRWEARRTFGKLFAVEQAKYEKALN